MSTCRRKRAVSAAHGTFDHASGSNRVDKFERDIWLLSEALKTEPGNHRYQFYLAQSLRRRPHRGGGGGLRQTRRDGRMG